MRGDEEGSDSECLPPVNARYQTGCPNLLSCAFRSIFLAEFTRKYYLNSVLDDLSTSGLCGILWYQGCNDASSTPDISSITVTEPVIPVLKRQSSNADNYGIRFEAFVSFIRENIPCVMHLVNEKLKEFDIIDKVPFNNQMSLHEPLVPIVTTAITTTRAWLTETNTIRYHQLKAPNTISNLQVVDALGCGLLADCVHINALGSTFVGHLMAKSMQTLLACNLHGAVHNNTTVLEVCNIYPTHVRRAYNVLKIAIETCDRRLSDSKTCRESNFRSSVILKDRKEGKLPILQTGLAPVNFVYGEISFISIVQVLQLVSNICGEFAVKGKFVDLGCGGGIAIAAALLCFSFESVIGIDLMRSKIELCAELVDELQRCPIESIQNQTNIPIVTILEGNFLEHASYWSDASVVYICSTCFAVDQMNQLNVIFRQMKVLACLILLDKQLHPDLVFEQRKMDDACDDSRTSLFVLKASMQCNVTWGTAAAFIYQKIK